MFLLFLNDRGYSLRMRGHFFFFLMLGVRGIRGPRHLECARGKGKGALFT